MGMMPEGMLELGVTNRAQIKTSLHGIAIDFILQILTGGNKFYANVAIDVKEV